MRTRNRFGTILALAGLWAGGAFGAQQAQAKLTQQAASAAASKNAVKTNRAIEAVAPQTLRGRYDKIWGLSNTPPKNQRQRRKLRRQRYAAGDRRAFA